MTVKTHCCLPLLPTANRKGRINPEIEGVRAPEMCTDLKPLVSAVGALWKDLGDERMLGRSRPFMLSRCHGPAVANGGGHTQIQTPTIQC